MHGKITITIFISLFLAIFLFHNAEAFMFYDDKRAPSITTGFFRNEYPLMIDSTGFSPSKFSDGSKTTISLENPVQIKLRIFEESGPHNIVNVTLSINDNSKELGDAYIMWSSENPIHNDVKYWVRSQLVENQPSVGSLTQLDETDFSVKINDAGKLFENVTISASYVNYKLEIAYDVKFSKPINASNITIGASDNRGNKLQTIVFDALEIAEN